MKVLHLLKTSVGASWALRQTRELVRLGVDVHIALPDGPMVTRYQQAGVTTHVFDPALNLKHWWKNPAQSRQLRSCVLRVEPDLVHSHFVATTLQMRVALRELPVPRIFHIPGPLHLEHRLYRYLDIGSADQRDYYLASCRWTEQALARFGVEKERIGLAYYGVNEGDFTQASDSSLDVRQALGAQDNDFVIGMVAYFYGPKPYLGQTRGLKGHEDLIDAIALVRKSHPQAKVVFVGGPWGGAQRYYDKVCAYGKARLGDACLFLGPRDDVPSLYRQFDLAVHPSHSENVGGAVESMYARVPTLTTDVGGFPDLVVPGQTGFMAPAKDPAALAAQIRLAIDASDQCQGLVNNAYEKVTQVMNVEKNAREVLQFYQQVLTHSQGRGHGQKVI